MLPKSLHESVVVATLLSSASKWKKEGEGKGGMCVLSNCPDGDECHVNANVVVVVMSLSGHEETLGKDDKDLRMIKLRGSILCVTNEGIGKGVGREYLECTGAQQG